MSQKWTSVIAEGILAICGAIFFYMSYNFNDGAAATSMRVPAIIPCWSVD
jgi:hypothetical protein